MIRMKLIFCPMIASPIENHEESLFHVILCYFQIFCRVGQAQKSPDSLMKEVIKPASRHDDETDWLLFEILFTIIKARLLFHCVVHLNSCLIFVDQCIPTLMGGPPRSCKVSFHFYLIFQFCSIKLSQPIFHSIKLSQLIFQF